MGQNVGGCCESKCSQTSVVTIVDEFCTQKYPGNPGLGVSDSVPEWSPEVEAERAAEAWAQCSDDLQRRTNQFVRRALSGIPCWFIDQQRGRTVPASYVIDDSLETFMIETAVQCTSDLASEGTARHIAYKCHISDIRNVWVCADSELARRTHGTLKHACDADYACTMLLDTLHGPAGLVERSSEAREEFLDCMAVLIAAQRLRKEPEIACCRSASGPPPPEARLRPIGKSLESTHVSGPICIWLAKAAEGVVSRADPDPRKLSRQNSRMNGYSAGTDFSPPQAPTAARKVHSEAFLVDIDAPNLEGPRGPVPLLTPQWKRSNLVAVTGRAIQSDPLGGSAAPRSKKLQHDPSLIGAMNLSPKFEHGWKTGRLLPGPLECEFATPRKMKEPLETEPDSEPMVLGEEAADID